MVQVVDAVLLQPSTHGGTLSSVLPAMSQLGLWPGPAAAKHVMTVVEHEIDKLVRLQPEQMPSSNILSACGLRGLLWAGCVAPRNTFAHDHLARLIDLVLESDLCAHEQGATGLYILNIAKQVCVLCVVVSPSVW